MARSTSAGSATSATGSMDAVGAAAGEHQAEFLVAGKRFASDRRRRARRRARAASARGVGLALGPARLALGGDQRLEPARLAVDQRLEAAQPAPRWRWA